MRSASVGFSRNPRLSAAIQPTGFQPVVVWRGAVRASEAHGCVRGERLEDVLAQAAFTCVSSAAVMAMAFTSTGWLRQNTSSWSGVKLRVTATVPDCGAGAVSIAGRDKGAWNFTSLNLFTALEFFTLGAAAFLPLTRTMPALLRSVQTVALLMSYLRARSILETVGAAARMAVLISSGIRFAFTDLSSTGLFTVGDGEVVGCGCAGDGAAFRFPWHGSPASHAQQMGSSPA